MFVEYVGLWSMGVFWLNWSGNQNGLKSSQEKRIAVLV
jgi:hypothetical protein